MKYRAVPLFFFMIAALSVAVSAQMGSAMNSGPISGSVVDGTGKPLADARIELYSLGGGPVVRSGYTNPAGSFELGDVAYGEYEVVAQHGINEARERVSVHGGGSILTLRITGAAAAVGDVGGRHSVSVVQLQIPGKARRHLRKAEKALRNGEYANARENVNKALGEFDKFPEALVMRGVLALDENQLDAAMADFQKAIEIDASCVIAYVAMASAFNLKSQFDEAVRSTERALTLAPNNWQAYFEQGKAQVGKADYGSALRALDRAAQFVPDGYAPIHLVKAHALLGLKNYPEAMYELQAYIDREPAGPSVDNARQALEKVRAFAAKGTQ